MTNIIADIIDEVKLLPRKRFNLDGITIANDLIDKEIDIFTGEYAGSGLWWVNIVLPDSRGKSNLGIEGKMKEIDLNAILTAIKTVRSNPGKYLK